jgi:DNA-binding transcriptional MerR regulator
MNPSPKTPVYNLKAVVCETGLKPDTIRAWERRYGLPEPQRADSGHRLYSQNDINMLKWLIARQDEGMSISRAVVLWRQWQDGSDQTTEGTAAIISQPAVGTPETTPPTGIADTVAQLRDAWVNYCLHFDEQGAERIIAQAFALFPVETIGIGLIQRGLAQIGESWYGGKVTVQQEHFASALATRRLEALITGTPAPTRTSRILVGCPPGETHTLAPMLLTLLLRRRGWDVIFLGADIPLENLILTTRSARPQLVILVAQQLHTAATLWEMGQLLLNEHIPMAYGGRIFTQVPNLRPRIPGHYLGDQLDSAAQQVEQIMALPRAHPALISADPRYQDALRQFRARQAEIEAEVWRNLGPAPLLEEHLNKVNASLGRNIIAALTLGDLDFMQLDLAWLLELFHNHFAHIEQQLVAYLQVYIAAVEKQTNGGAPLIASWLHTALQLNFPEALSDPPRIEFAKSIRNTRLKQNYTN